MKSGRRMKKTKNNNRIIKKISIFIIILCIACIILINNKENINLYYKASANPLQYKNSANVELQNPSFEVDSFDDPQGVTYNKSLTGWKTPSSDGIIGVKYNPNFLNNTQYFFELNESAKKFIIL